MYVEATQTVMLVGGFCSGTYSEAYSWDGTAWTKVEAKTVLKTAIGRDNVWPLHRRTAELGGNLRTGLEDLKVRRSSSRRPPAAMVLLSDGSATDGAAADIVAALSIDDAHRERLHRLVDARLAPRQIGLLAQQAIDDRRIAGVLELRERRIDDRAVLLQSRAGDDRRLDGGLVGDGRRGRCLTARDHPTIVRSHTAHFVVASGAMPR